MKKRIIISTIISISVLIFCIGKGSVNIAPKEMWEILLYKLFGASLHEEISPLMVSIFWSIRMPRALAAFMVGGALAVSGAVMQSVLQNPLASSYTIGVSSGASLGAAIIIICNFSIAALQNFMLPVTGFIFGLATVILSIALASGLDRNIQNQTIVLVGMVMSLFVSAGMTLLSSLFPNHSQQIYLWMMGSFSSKNWIHVAILTGSAVLGTLAAFIFSRELDIMTFGDEQAMSLGVNIKRQKKWLLLLAALMTGVAVSFTGVIGFIDLVAPHVVRRIFGPRHKVLIPMTMLTGGAMMALADLVSRTIISPREIPVGAVTALIGAPFFALIYFRKR